MRPEWALRQNDTLVFEFRDATVWHQHMNHRAVLVSASVLLKGCDYGVLLVHARKHTGLQLKPDQRGKVLFLNHG